MGEPEDSRALLRAVTFDVTHTLIHAPRLAEIYGEVLTRHGLLEAPSAASVGRAIRRAWEELSCRGGPTQDRFATFEDGAEGFWHRFLERVCVHLGAAEPSRFASAELYQRFARAEAWDVYPDVPPALERLRHRGLRLGVVSNWDSRLPALLGELDLSFDAVVYSAELGLEKPHPGIFRACLNELGVSPEEALHVGDRRIEDAEGADALGMAYVLLEECDRDDPSTLGGLLEPHLPTAPIHDRQRKGLHLVD